MNTAPQPQLTADLVVTAVLHGMLDSDLDRLREAVSTRRKVLASTAAAMLKAGDRFIVTNISPKYLAGCTVEYTGQRAGKWYKCRMVDYASSRFPAGGSILLQAAHVGEVL